MRALLDQAASLQRQHAVGVFDGRQAVRDDQCRAPEHQPLQRVLHSAFALAVQCRRGLVQDQHRRVLGDGARDGQPLALAARQLVAVVADRRVQALRQALGKVQQVGAAQGRAHRFARHFGPQRDIARQRVVEQHDVLADQRELAAQCPHVPVVQRHAVQADAARRRLDEAGQQVHQGGLAGTRRTDQRHGLAGPHLQRQAVHRRQAIVVISQADRVVANLAAGAPAGGLGRVAAALLGRALPDQVQAPFDRREAARQRGHHVGQVLGRRNQLQHGRHEGHEGTHRGAAAAALPQRDDDDHRQCAGRQHLRHRRHRAAGGHGLHHQAAHAVGALLEAASLLGFGAMQPHDAPGQHVLFHHVGQLVGGLLTFDRQAVQPPAQRPHHQRHGREQQADDQRQLPVQRQQVDQQGQQHQCVAHQRQHRRRQDGHAGLRLVDQGVGHAAGGLLREQGRGAVQQPLEQAHAQLQHRAVAGPGQPVLGDEAGDAAQGEQADDGQRHQPQRQSAAGKALVQQLAQQPGDGGFGGRGHGRAQGGGNQARLAAAQVGQQARQALQQGRHGGGMGSPVRGRSGWLGGRIIAVPRRTGPGPRLAHRRRKAGLPTICSIRYPVLPPP